MAPYSAPIAIRWSVLEVAGRGRYNPPHYIKIIHSEPA